MEAKQFPTILPEMHGKLYFRFKCKYNFSTGEIKWNGTSLVLFSTFSQFSTDTRRPFFSKRGGTAFVAMKIVCGIETMRVIRSLFHHWFHWSIHNSKNSAIGHHRCGYSSNNVETGDWRTTRSKQNRDDPIFGNRFLYMKASNRCTAAVLNKL